MYAPDVGDAAEEEETVAEQPHPSLDLRSRRNGRQWKRDHHHSQPHRLRRPPLRPRGAFANQPSKYTAILIFTKIDMDLVFTNEMCVVS